MDKATQRYLFAFGMLDPAHSYSYTSHELVTTCIRANLRLIRLPYCRRVNSKVHWLVCTSSDKQHSAKVLIYNMRILMFKNCLFRRYVFTFISTLQIPFERSFTRTHKTLLWGPLKACEEPSDRSPDCGREGLSDRSPNCGREGPLVPAQAPLKEVWKASKVSSKAFWKACEGV